MRLLRSGIVLALFAAGGLSIAPASASHTDVPPIDRSRVPVLAGETTIIGDSNGWTRVRVPKDVPLNGIYDYDTQIQARGRIVGMFMLQEKDGEIDPKGADIWLTRSGMCAGRACEMSRWSGPSMSSDARDGKLPAGTYRIYLVVDGAPAKVFFKMPGLSGATRINPTREVRAKVETLDPQLPDASKQLYAAGNEAPFGGPGLSVQSQWIDPIGAGVIDSGYCYYRRSAPEDPSTAYLPPGCEFSPTSLLLAQRVTPIAECCWGFNLSLPFVPKAMGSWYTSTAPVEASGAAALWLKLK